MPAPVEAPAGTWSIWKPKDTEFTTHDIQLIAEALSLAVSDVLFTMTDGIVNMDIDGHVLSGSALPT